jgi:hypothetical protein
MARLLALTPGPGRLRIHPHDAGNSTEIGVVHQYKVETSQCIVNMVLVDIIPLPTYTLLTVMDLTNPIPYLVNLTLRSSLLRLGDLVAQALQLSYPIRITQQLYET